MNNISINPVAKSYLQQSAITLFFGIASIVFGFAQYKVPGFNGVYSDFREIPLLIALFYIEIPVFILPLSLLTTISVFYTANSFFSSTFLMHFIPLFIIWYGFQWINKNQKQLKFQIAYWVICVVIYYVVLTLPTMLLIDGFLNDKDVLHFNFYLSILRSLYFELFSSILISALYLMQLFSRKELKLLNTNLEDTVNLRTAELVSSNGKLEAANEEFRILNENLEILVSERTKQIQLQLGKLKAYAFSNSHEVRGPLARILGIVQLIEMETNLNAKLELVEKLKIASEELDLVVRKLNKILEEEDF